MLSFHIVEVSTSDRSKWKLFVQPLEVRYILESLIKVDVSAATSIYKIIKRSAGTRSKPFEESMSAISPEPVLKQIETEQLRQISSMSLSVKSYGREEQ